MINVSLDPDDFNQDDYYDVLDLFYAAIENKQNFYLSWESNKLN